jgi:hypothetical protein
VSILTIPDSFNIFHGITAPEGLQTRRLEAGADFRRDSTNQEASGARGCSHSWLHESSPLGWDFSLAEWANDPNGLEKRHPVFRNTSCCREAGSFPPTSQRPG